MCFCVNPRQAMDVVRERTWSSSSSTSQASALPLFLCSSSISLEKFHFPKSVVFQTFLFPESNTVSQNLLGSKVEFCLTWDMYVGLYCPLQKCPCPSPQKSHCALLWSFCLEHSLSTLI